MKSKHQVVWSSCHTLTLAWLSPVAGSIQFDARVMLMLGTTFGNPDNPGKSLKDIKASQNQRALKGTRGHSLGNTKEEQIQVCLVLKIFLLCQMLPALDMGRTWCEQVSMCAQYPCVNTHMRMWSPDADFKCLLQLSTFTAEMESLTDPGAPCLDHTG